MPQQCNNMAGHSNCAAHILRTHLNKQGGCPGACIACVSRYKGHPEAVPIRAQVFMEDPAAALRYMGHSKHRRRKHNEDRK